ncbi:Toprim domain-containing protein [Pontibacter ummariensis]|uniref:Toprim-like n=1 Tax=Pontibacter ummariensis TaxID=1610492 RepID=A0A239JCI8_9BACT|nr:DUF3991 domain-containing protein [Pontibacter ummariensis]PRY08343.1 Toprim domain-containing protein [Pontibacter ummariensis]SNT03128.1 Toprim-like [Pontibacter ummariensis]
MTFQEYREQVSIIQVAESLGYVFDPLKGRKSPEFKHPDGDRIIINNPGDSSRQMYFNRDGSNDKGSVIDFVANRLHRFQGSFRNEIDGINRVLSRYAYASQPKAPIYNVTEAKPFDKRKFVESETSVFKLHYLIKERGLSSETVQLFLPYIRLVRDAEKDNAYTNIAFPLQKPTSSETIGYDLRNYGFKGVAAGSDRKHGVWVADFAQNPVLTRHVYFAENPIDAMSFYQLEKDKRDFSNSVFVSFGGGMSRMQVELSLQAWPNAQKHTIFDNDYQGKIYDIYLATAIAGKPYAFTKNADSITFSLDEKKFDIPVDKLSLFAFEKNSGIRSGLQVHKPLGHKDYNDIIHPKNDQENRIPMKVKL